MITAVAVGQDIFGRLRRFVEWQQDWNISPVMGVFAAAATASRILGPLPRRDLQRAGDRHHAVERDDGGRARHERSSWDLRRVLGPGRGRGDACWRKKGISGLDAPFEGKYGFLNTYFDGNYDRDKILDGLGTEFTGSATLYKRWASVSTSHSHIHATLGTGEGARPRRRGHRRRSGSTPATGTT